MLSADMHARAVILARDSRDERPSGEEPNSALPTGT